MMQLKKWENAHLYINQQEGVVGVYSKMSFRAPQTYYQVYQTRYTNTFLLLTREGVLIESARREIFKRWLDRLERLRSLSTHGAQILHYQVFVSTAKSKIRISLKILQSVIVIHFKNASMPFRKVSNSPLLYVVVRVFPWRQRWCAFNRTHSYNTFLDKVLTAHAYKMREPQVASGQFPNKTHSNNRKCTKHDTNTSQES